jgi:plasmid stabilization system protein ParE
MSSGYALHPEAFADLDDIRDYIAQENPDAADRVISEIFDTIRGLVPFPHQGRLCSDLSSRPLRFALVREYLIAYAPEEKQKSAYGVFIAQPTNTHDDSVQ